LPLFAAFFASITLVGIGMIFGFTIKKRGLKSALLLSTAGLVSFIAIFFALLALKLNIM
jgi:hypothetical protein